MTISDHLSDFEGLPVVEFSEADRIHQPGNHAFRLSLGWDAHDSGQTILDLFAKFIGDPGAAEVTSLVIGDWGGAGQGDDSSSIVEALVSARDRLPKLRALFLGEIVTEESEISWISQSDVSPLFEAFPHLETLYLRGGNGLRLGKPRHQQLRKLVIETGGMSAAIVSDVASAELPRLRHLELWLGDQGYGNDVTTDDLRQLLVSGPCRNLSHLGLRDDCRADQTAQLLAELGVPTTLEVLDLSLGTLGDDGAKALAESAWLKQLKQLDIHHHYVSEFNVARLRSIVNDLIASEPQKPDDWGDGTQHRYVAVGE